MLVVVFVEQQQEFLEPPARQMSLCAGQTTSVSPWPTSATGSSTARTGLMKLAAVSSETFYDKIVNSICDTV